VSTQSGLVVTAVVVGAVVVPTADCSDGSSFEQPGTKSAKPSPPAQPSTRLRVRGDPSVRAIAAEPASPS
jgi:hypothetical protein